MSLGDLFGDNPHRPEHPDMRVLVDLVLKHDGKTEDPDFNMDEYLATVVDPPSISHMASQRALRLAHLFGRPKDVQFLLRITSFWFDGFLIGNEFRRRKATPPTALLADLKAAQARYESAYRESTTEENEAADEFFEHFDRLVEMLGWEQPD